MDIADPRIDPSLVPDGSRAVVIAEHQSEYRDLPSVRTPGGQVITRWSLTDDERQAVLKGEDIFVTLALQGAFNELVDGQDGLPEPAMRHRHPKAMRVELLMERALERPWRVRDGDDTRRWAFPIFANDFAGTTHRTTSP